MKSEHIFKNEGIDVLVVVPIEAKDIEGYDDTENIREEIAKDKLNKFLDSTPAEGWHRVI